MELIIFFVATVAGLGLLDIAALRWGKNSRHVTSDWQPRSDSELYTRL